MSDSVKISDHVAIPENELDFRFVTGGGPGGQHVNKAATKVILSFDVAGSPTLLSQLSERDRVYLLERLSHRLTNEGVLKLHVHETRSQSQNRQIAVFRLQEILREGLRRPKKRKKTRPSRATNQARLDAKKRRGEVKRGRSKKWG
ncbi:MAG: alternative ribosome rescue aminoacyl-tRNA hydrolase ArfB [Ardenticatenaceae bacterium]|nr:alternative ribosome rescue aminoacyl-tRNA hydrolase ArfB [Ardenticatenaceae bacterium]